MIRLMIVDDHPIVRAGLAGLLADESGFEVVADVADGESAVRLAPATRPDVVLMDLRMPGIGGVEATRRLREQAPGLRVLVLTTYEDDDEILAAIEAGAAGYLLKAAPIEEVAAGIRSVAAGGTALSPAVAARLVQRMREPAQASPPELTPRELEVLRLVSAGQSNKLIAAELGIGAATVKTHLDNVFDKLGVDSRTRAVTLAIERGLLD